MFTEPMHGPVAVMLFWIWLGIVVVVVIAYRVLGLGKRKPPEKTPPKYAAQLRHRMQKKSDRGKVAEEDAQAHRKPR